MTAPRLEILTFHRLVSEGESYFIPPMAMSAGTFSRLLKSLQRRYQILPLNEAVRTFGSGDLRRPIVALTFDDGYADNFHLARAILLEEGLSATFFIPLAPIQAGVAYWWDRLFHVASRHTDDFIEFLDPWVQQLSLGSLPVAVKPTDAREVGCFCRKVVSALNAAGKAIRDSFLEQLEAWFGAYNGPSLLMSMDEVRTLARDGFEVGSHTMNHALLPELPPATVRSELLESKECLERALGRSVEGFSYPRGAYTPEISRQVRDAGYAYAVTTRYGSNSIRSDIHQLTRRNMSNYQGLRSRFPIPMHMLEISGCLDPLLSKRR